MADHSLEDIAFQFVEGHDGNRLRVATLGKGPLVLMVHGWPDAWLSWRPQMKAVADAGFRAAALEVRGYGESDAPHAVSEYSILKLAGDNIKVIDALSDDGKAVLIGHDWGAPIVYYTAIIHPKKISAVVGLSSIPPVYFPKKPSEFWDQLYPEKLFYQQYFTRNEGEAEAEFERDLDRFVRITHFNLSGATTLADPIESLVRPAGSTTFLDGQPEPDAENPPSWLTQDEIDAYVDVFRKNGLRGTLNRYRAQDIDWDDLLPYKDAKIPQPAIFIGGTREPSRFMQGFDRYADPVKRYADPRGVFLVEGAGHWVQREAPDQVNKHIIDFLKTL